MNFLTVTRKGKARKCGAFLSNDFTAVDKDFKEELISKNIIICANINHCGLLVDIKKMI